MKADNLPEGWTKEHSTEGNYIVLCRPQSAGGGFVTVHFERRDYSMGCYSFGPFLGAEKYKGRGWQEKLTKDAADHLEKIMTSGF